MFPQLDKVRFEETEKWLKVVMPIRRNLFLLALFSVALVVWVGMLISIVNFMIRDVIMVWQRFSFAFTVMLLVWIVVWYYVGKVVWGRWQYYVADRELLFIDEERLIVRRPVSILGITDAYDREYVSPFSYNDEHQCVMFDYGSNRIYFGHSLGEPDAKGLIRYLNGRYFPHHDDDDDE